MLKLGTGKHHGAFLDQIDKAKQIGCFGLTELGQATADTRQLHATAVASALTAPLCLLVSASFCPGYGNNAVEMVGARGTKRNGRDVAEPLDALLCDPIGQTPSFALRLL